MFNRIEFYDNLTGHLVSPWWIYLVIGVNLVLLSILIFFFPDLLAYLVAAFLLINGIFFLSLAIQLRKLRKKYEEWRKRYWIEVE
ncbi:MAG: hypothetical protein KatS3mg029_0553 [Saprospiraceae bacterium]|nr:MAG: hypothetical protein KatS3mg029_0553 [Saprospiraceae bacterium]